MAKLTFDNAGNLYGTTTGFKGGLGLRFVFTTISIPLYFSE